MKIEPAEQFAGKTAHALRPHGYGENVEALIAEHAPLVRKIAWQVHSPRRFRSPWSPEFRGRRSPQHRGMSRAPAATAPGAAEMAEAMGMSADEYFEFERSATHGRSTSLDEMMNEGDFLFADDRFGAGELLEQEGMLDALRACIGRLSDREQMVLQLYFFEELNLQEIGLTLDVSAARVCQIKRDAMAKIDRMMREMTE